MEKSDQPVNGSLTRKGEIDPDSVLGLFKTFRFGKDNIPPPKIRSMAVETAPPDNTTEMPKEEDNNGSHVGLVGATSVHESTSSVSSTTDPIILESSLSETGSNNDPGSNSDPGSNNEPNSNEETGYSTLESSSTNLQNVENEMQQKVEDDAMEEEEEEDRERSPSEWEEKSNLEMFLATQDEYELYCPSCSKCVTRNLILKKVKRGSHDLTADLKPNGNVVTESSEIEEIELPAKVDDVPEKEEGVMYTCLACLKYYIRLGARFLQFDYVKVKPVEEPESLPEDKPDQERFSVELMKSTVYGGLTETITSLGVVASASASGSSTENILVLAVANLVGGLIVLAQNIQDLRNNSDQEKDRYVELLGSRANVRMHILVAVLSYFFFGLIPPLVYAFSFYETGIKNYKLLSVFFVSLVCVLVLGMIKVYIRKQQPNVRESAKSYLKAAAFYTSIVVASSGISYVVGDIGGEYIRKLGWFSLDKISITSPFDGTKPDDFRFTSF